jgi:V/A-type H+-transporting ATPase subunit C
MAKKIVLPKVESRSLKYGYSNARVKGMKGLLLKQSELDEMIKVATVQAMVELLHKTGYKNELAAASVDYSGSALVELAASRNFARIVRKLLKLSPKEDGNVIRALLVRWDLLNLKSIMHAKRLKRSYEEVRPYLFDVGGLKEDDFKRIMKADETAIMRELRRTELGERMLSIGTASLNIRMKESFTNALRSLDRFLQMETIVDAYIYLFMDHALAEVGGSDVSQIRELLRREIDAKNVLIVERLKKHNTSKEKIIGSLIKGGTLGEPAIQKLIEAKDLHTVVNIIKPKFRQLELKAEKLKLTDLEIALEKSIAAQRMLAFHTTVLSVGVIVGFLLLKEEEINNIRKIAKSKEFNIPESEVHEMLVVV